tara:strand:- start:524 stop:1615 length:1092 start_codon:yes stop_codon:yes gene_type:complete
MSLERQSEIFAYKFLKKDFSQDQSRLDESLDHLLELSLRLSSPLLRELKPSIAFNIKWKFDYLAKTGESPFLLRHDLDYWTNILRMLDDLSTHNWFTKGEDSKNIDIWNRTKDAFNFMWPQNTIGDNYEVSKKMASLRLEQIIDMIDGAEQFIENSIIVDSGCGPGRYVDVLNRYNPKRIIGVDSGKDIIAANRKRFSINQNIEMIQSSCDNLPLDNNYADFVISAGVIHHLPNPIEELITEHARIVKKNGYLFIFIAGTGGLELSIWKFMRQFLYDVTVDELFNRFNKKISSLRLQGLLDHSYGEYQQTERHDLERWLTKHFSDVKRVTGIKGLDVTEELYANDIYFPYRFGSGNLRYLCRK